MSTSAPPTSPLRAPSATAPSSSVVVAGPSIAAIDRLKLFSADEWEEFVLEWADSLRERYESVERHGGPNDLGCDVVAYLRDADGAWDNYQCKHYSNRLTPGDVWPEIGKLLVNAYRGLLSVPQSYVFVAPQGAGTTLAKLLHRPDELRKGLLDVWDRKCRAHVSPQRPVELDDGLRAYIASFDFSIFAAAPPLRLLDQHAETRWHAARFGSGLPARPPVPTPPATPASEEAVYVGELLGAYGDHLRQSVASLSDLESSAALVEHFYESRIAFYSAEGLRVFSRDTLPPGSFDALQDDVHAGIKNDVRQEHRDGYARVLAVTRTAQSLALTAHALGNTATVPDRHGMCHQLANDGKVRWTT
jgi:hypothetical protein